MKTIAAVEVDLERSPLGTASRLADDLCGTPVLRRTLGRMARCRRVDAVHVIVPAEQRARAARLVDGLPVRIESHNAGRPAWQALTSAARKWSLDGWRGGIAGACWFDEQLHASVLAALGTRENADAVVVVPAAAALVDPDLIDAMIAHHETIADAMRMTFTVAPPGLAGLVIRPDLLGELAAAGTPPSQLLAYRPDHPGGGYLNQKFCYQTPNTVAHTAVRLLADTERGVAVIRDVLAEAGEGASAETICRVAAGRDKVEESLPREVELELTTADQLAETQLRPRGVIVPRRGPVAVDLVRRLVDELRAFDDSLLILGGFGEPLLHPGFGELLEICRPVDDERGGVFGLGVRTNGIALDAAMRRRLLEHGVDLLTVTLDAHSSETYTRVHGHDAFDQVTAHVNRLLDELREARMARPLVLPEMIKARETTGEMEAFYDHWLRTLGAAVITGYSHHAGQLPDRAVVGMAPPRRVACRRLATRTLVLADGSVVACDQDFKAKHVLGSLHEATLREIWTGSAYARLRDAHVGQRFNGWSLCTGCDEWHRP